MVFKVIVVLYARLIGHHVM